MCIPWKEIFGIKSTNDCDDGFDNPPPSTNTRVEPLLDSSISEETLHPILPSSVTQEEWFRLLRDPNACKMCHRTNCTGGKRFCAECRNFYGI